MTTSGGSERSGGSEPAQEPTTTAPEDPDAPVTAGVFDRPAGPPPDDPAGVRDEIEAGLGPTDAIGIAGGGDPIYVSLRAGREGIADELLARFGERVQVDVGGIQWSLGKGVEALAGCADPLAPGDLVEGLSAVVTPDADEVPLGADVTGSVVVTSTGSETVTVEWGGAGVPAYLVQTGTDEPVGAFLGIQTMQISHATVAPGESSAPLPIVVGVTSCTPAAGTAVQPGRYDLVAVVNLDDGRTIRSAPTVVTVSAP